MFITLLFDERLLSKSGDGNDEASSFAPPSVLSELEPKLDALPIVDVSRALKLGQLYIISKSQIHNIPISAKHNTRIQSCKGREPGQFGS